jgi:hypothetical protein
VLRSISFAAFQRHTRPEVAQVAVELSARECCLCPTCVRPH